MKLICNKKYTLLVLAISTGLIFTSSRVQAQLTAADITDVILITGQSNVTGSQTEYNPALDAIDQRVFAYTSANVWEVADLHQAWDVDDHHPGNASLTDSSRSPYNHFGFHFARTVVQNDPSRVVGIIIASAPGEGIQHWDAGGQFSQVIDSKVLDALNAQGVKSQLDGILWHQGETDFQFRGTSDVDASSAERSNTTYYPEKLDLLIQAFRNRNWFADQKPFICGETKRAHVNGRLMALNIDEDSWTGCVPARDLCTRERQTPECNDVPILGTHFDAAALRTLGQRYGHAYLAMVGQNSTVPTCNGLPVTVNLSLGQTPGPGDDVILGTPGNDDIRGRAGNDTICGQGGNDFIHGNSGDDWIDGGNGVDNIRGGQGDDVIFTGSGTTVGTNSRAFGGTGIDIIYGGPDADDLRGGRGHDTLLGGEGNDEINGNENNDVIFGFSGNDILRGGVGESDRLYGGFNMDSLNGGFGVNDYCDTGGSGGDNKENCELQ